MSSKNRQENSAFYWKKPYRTRVIFISLQKPSRSAPRFKEKENSAGEWKLVWLSADPLKSPVPRKMIIKQMFRALLVLQRLKQKSKVRRAGWTCLCWMCYGVRFSSAQPVNALYCCCFHLEWDLNQSFHMTALAEQRHAALHSLVKFRQTRNSLVTLPCNCFTGRFSRRCTRAKTTTSVIEIYTNAEDLGAFFTCGHTNLTWSISISSHAFSDTVFTINWFAERIVGGEFENEYEGRTRPGYC